MQSVAEEHAKQFERPLEIGSHWHKLELLMKNPGSHVKQVTESVHVKQLDSGTLHN